MSSRGTSASCASPAAKAGGEEATLEGGVAGNYDLLRVLGKGTMGVVYLGRHRKLGKNVALKVLRPEHCRDRALMQRFFQEARAVNEINHEHIVEIHDFVEEPDRAYCVMELLTGTAREQGTTVVLVTHEPRVAAYADREVVVRDGRVTSLLPEPVSS